MTNLKVYINRPENHSPWGGGAKFVNSFFKYAPEFGIDVIKPSDQVTAPDVALVVDIVDSELGSGLAKLVQYREFNKFDDRKFKIVLRVNENDARKATTHVDKNLILASEYVDSTIFVSHWLQNYFLEKGWVCDDQSVVYNGVDHDIFRPQPKLNNGKINIVTHHWSNNYLKGFDIYDRLDEFVGLNSNRFTFTYIGRERGSFKNTKLVHPLSGKALGSELGK